MTEVSNCRTFDLDDPETIAYHTKPLTLVLADALYGPHCRQELDLSDDDRSSSAHGQLIVLEHA